MSKRNMNSVCFSEDGRVYFVLLWTVPDFHKQLHQLFTFACLVYFKMCIFGLYAYWKHFRFRIEISW